MQILQELLLPHSDSKFFISEGNSRSSIASFRFDALTFSKSIRKLASSLMPCNDRKHVFVIY